MRIRVVVHPVVELDVKTGISPVIRLSNSGTSEQRVRAVKILYGSSSGDHDNEYRAEELPKQGRYLRSV
jgi:hypothetical protein